MRLYLFYLFFFLGLFIYLFIFFFFLFFGGLTTSADRNNPVYAFCLELWVLCEVVISWSIYLFFFSWFLFVRSIDEFSFSIQVLKQLTLHVISILILRNTEKDEIRLMFLQRCITKEGSLPRLKQKEKKKKWNTGSG